MRASSVFLTIEGRERVTVQKPISVKVVNRYEKGQISIDWYSRLYMDDGLEEKKEKLIHKIEHAAGTPGVYLITLASNEKNLLDIFSADQLLWPVMHRLCPVIIGMTRSYDSAVELASSIILESYEKTGTFRIDTFLRQRLDENEPYVVHYPLKKRKRRWGFHFWGE